MTQEVSLAPETKAGPRINRETGKPLVERPERSRVQRWLPYLLTAPGFFVPTCMMFVGWLGQYWSLTDYDMRYGIKTYLGLENYIYVLTQDRDFWNSVRVTFKFAITALLFEIPVGFVISMLLDRISSKIVPIVRAIVIIPYCIAPVVATLMMKVMMGPTTGVFNYFLKLLGLPQVDFLGDGNIAVYSLVLIDAWISIPWIVLVFWGGWQTLPKAPFEAAALDGAKGWFIFRKLTLPLLQPFIWIVLLFRTADSLNIMDVIYVSTKGGPGNATRTLSMLSFDNGMGYSHIGYGTAMITYLFYIVMTIEKQLVSRFPR